MFLDEAAFEAVGGRGGDGIVAFRREKFVPRGGPSGGNGGRGGAVVLRAAAGLASLAGLAGVRRVEADPGRSGGRNRMTGASGADRIIDVPVGTVVRDLATGDVLADLVEEGARVVVAAGGRGGRGNAAFATARRRAPRERERGAPGEERRVGLEIRLIADVGLVGLPNAGKSTLLAALTRARPKIAAYPFTTLEPVLGVVEAGGRGAPFVLADLPGLIEGASRGRGLGVRFLRHVERTRLLLFMADVSGDPVADLATVSREVAAFSEALAARPRRALLSKTDLVPPARVEEARAALVAAGWDAASIDAASAATRAGLEGLVRSLAAAVATLPPPAPLPRTATHRFEPPWTVRRDEDGGWTISGKRIERRAAMIDLDSIDSLRRFWRLLERIGAAAALRAAGARAGDEVRIGGEAFEYDPGETA